MKIKITMKDPDGVYDSIKDAVTESLNSTQGISDEEKDILFASRQEYAMDKLSSWLEYNECVTLEFDLETGTATVVKVKHNI